jgi:lipoprotein NlpI
MKALKSLSGRVVVVIACCALALPGSSLAKTKTLRLQHRAKPVPTTFEPSELNGFLAKLASAESIGDPLQRCLAYPDPPGSHWRRSAVTAYCRYRSQHVVPAAEVESLIDNGHADILDRRMVDALRAQRIDPDSRGLLDWTFQSDFSTGSANLRRSIDAWKKQRPDSAFAYAASGFAYVNAAYSARGGDWIQRTPASQVAAMHGLAVLARKDLDRAVALDPHITPIYKAMLMAAKLEGDDDYARAGERRGLKVDPANYTIYVHMMQVAEPKWGGSLEQMRQVAKQARARSRRNPLLLLLQPEPELYAAGLCSCGGSTPEPSAYREILDRPVGTSSLSAAADSAAHVDQSPLAIVYRAEAVRFAPESSDELRWLIARLLKLQDDPSLRPGIDHALQVLTDHLVQRIPGESKPYEFRASSYELVGDNARAEADLLHALSLAPGDESVLEQLTQHYVMITHDWDKGWTVSSRLIQSHPENRYGWISRARIQSMQPRAGLQETARYIVEHFRNNKDARDEVEEAQRYLDKPSSPSR